jgi:hypothetical protein
MNLPPALETPFPLQDFSMATVAISKISPLCRLIRAQPISSGFSVSATTKLRQSIPEEYMGEKILVNIFLF